MYFAQTELYDSSFYAKSEFEVFYMFLYTQWVPILFCFNQSWAAVQTPLKVLNSCFRVSQKTSNTFLSQ